MFQFANFEHLNKNPKHNSLKHIKSTLHSKQNPDGENKNNKHSYLVVLPVSFRVVRIGVVLEELSHIGHDGLLIRFIHIHILK